MTLSECGKRLVMLTKPRSRVRSFEIQWEKMATSQNDRNLAPLQDKQVFCKFFTVSDKMDSGYFSGKKFFCTPAVVVESAASSLSTRSQANENQG